MLFRHYLLFFIIICFANCGGHKNKSIAKENYNKQSILKNNVAQLQSGLDLTATGNEPTTWEIKINFEDSIYFIAADGNKFTIATNKSKVVKTDDEIEINSVLKNNNIAINIYNTYCSKTEKTQKVTITYLGKTYTGCGSYIQNKELQNKWTLYKYRNKFADDLPNVVSLILKLDNNKMIWNDGCSTLKSKIKIEGEKIFFSKISPSKNYCLDNEITSIFKTNINQGVATYYFKNDILYLYLLDDSMLMFKKSN